MYMGGGVELRSIGFLCWSEGGMRSVRPEREVSKVSILKGGRGSGSGQDFGRLGAGFPLARGRIPARAPVSGALQDLSFRLCSGVARGRGGGPGRTFPEMLQKS